MLAPRRSPRSFALALPIVATLSLPAAAQTAPFAPLQSFYPPGPGKRLVAGGIGGDWAKDLVVAGPTRYPDRRVR